MKRFNYVSDCCSCPPKSNEYIDLGICSSCHEHCNYDPQDEEEEIEKDFITNEEI